MTTPLDDTSTPGPLDLIETARQKYTLAQARIRRGPPELAMLSLHGSLEDALRSHALRRQLPAGSAPFPQLLAALAADDEAPLSAAEAEGIGKMHRLRARVAHGEQIAVTQETILAYQRLAARILPRYGVVVAPPEDPPPGEAERATGRTRPHPRAYPDPEEPRRRADPDEIVDPRRRPRDEPAGRGARRTTSTYPILDRYPDPARRPTRGLPDSDAQIDRAERMAGFFGRSQAWLLPLIIIVSIFAIGVIISIALQQLGQGPTPTAALPPTPAAIATTPASVSGVGVDPPIEPTALPPTPAPTELPPDALAPGRTAYVRDEVVGGLNVRAAPGVSDSSPILFSLAPGTAVEIVEGPQLLDGVEWWRVRSAGSEGWCSGEFLVVR